MHFRAGDQLATGEWPLIIKLKNPNSQFTSRKALWETIEDTHLRDRHSVENLEIHAESKTCVTSVSKPIHENRTIDIGIRTRGAHSHSCQARQPSRQL